MSSRYSSPSNSVSKSNKGKNDKVSNSSNNRIDRGSSRRGAMEEDETSTGKEVVYRSASGKKIHITITKKLLDLDPEAAKSVDPNLLKIKSETTTPRSVKSTKPTSPRKPKSPNSSKRIKPPPLNLNNDVAKSEELNLDLLNPKTEEDLVLAREAQEEMLMDQLLNEDIYSNMDESYSYRTNNSNSESKTDRMSRKSGKSPKSIKSGTTGDPATSKKENDSEPNRKEEENLGEDFESTPWLPPSVERAYQYQRDNIFRHGDTRIDSIDVTNAPDLSIGINLYFQFAMTMGLCLFVMTLFAIPALLFTSGGDGMSLEDRDNLGLYRYSLGNIGYNKDDRDFAEKSACLTPKYQGTNETCIHFYQYELSMTDTAYLLAGFECLQVTIFLLAVLQLYFSAETKSDRSSLHETSITDYAVMVTRLPPDISEMELIRHFSNLYQLHAPDWKGRPAVIGTTPVKSVSNTTMSVYKNTWIAECIIHKAIGQYIESFKNKQYLMKTLYHCRAKMKMYKSDTPHAHGPNPEKYKEAEHQMLLTGMKIDELTRHNIIQSGLKVFVDPNDDLNNSLESGEGGQLRARLQASKIDHRVNNTESIYYFIEADSTAAFIVFQYGESMARCINDYSRYNFPFSFFYPHQLLLRGHEIVVTKAPEPDQILWENLDVPASLRVYLRLRTAGITLVLVLVCFIIILQASIYKERFASSKPDLSLCDTYIPELYVNASSTINYNTISLVLPKASEQANSLDQQCHASLRDSFYARYAYNENFTNPITKYDVAVCNAMTAAAANYSFSGACPKLGAPAFCPCVTTDSSETCTTAGCSPGHTGRCISFTAGTIGACYCYKQLLAVLQTGDISTAIDPNCYDFYYQYGLSSGLTYGSVVATAMVNVLTRKCLKLLAKFEAYNSLDEFQASIMTKIFVTNLLTMGILVLVAYGNANSENAFLSTFHLFRGPYRDFTRGWYGNVGFYLVTTFIIQSGSPLVINLLRYYVILPILRIYQFRKVEAKTSHTIVMQEDLNKLMVGSIFDSTDHAAQLLALLFFSMMYGPGLPLLMPVGCMAFMLYFRVDKLLLCRYYQKPLNIGDGVIRRILFYLPFAAVIRLGFAVWMLSAPEILGTSSTSEAMTGSIASIAADQKESVADSSVKNRIYQPHVYFLYLYIFIILGGMFLKTFWKQLPFHYVLKYLYQWYRACCCGGKKKKRDLYADHLESAITGKGVPYHDHDPDDADHGNPEGKRKKRAITQWELTRSGDRLRKQSSPYTEDFYKIVKHKDYIPTTIYEMLTYGSLTTLTELEVEAGFKAESMDDYIVHVKVWPHSGMRRVQGGRSRAGEKKKTYEVIADHRCYSYNIEKIEEYKIAMRGLREGIMSFIEFLKKHETSMEDFLNQMEGMEDDEKHRQQKKNLLLLMESTGMTSHIVAEYAKRKSILQPGYPKRKGNTAGGKGKKGPTPRGRRFSLMDNFLEEVDIKMDQSSIMRSIIPKFLRRRSTQVLPVTEAEILREEESELTTTDHGDKTGDKNSITPRTLAMNDISPLPLISSAREGSVNSFGGPESIQEDPELGLSRELSIIDDSNEEEQRAISPDTFRSLGGRSGKFTRFSDLPPLPEERKKRRKKKRPQSKGKGDDGGIAVGEANGMMMTSDSEAGDDYLRNILPEEEQQRQNSKRKMKKKKKKENNSELLDSSPSWVSSKDIPGEPSLAFTTNSGPLPGPDSVYDPYLGGYIVSTYEPGQPVLVAVPVSDHRAVSPWSWNPMPGNDFSTSLYEPSAFGEMNQAFDNTWDYSSAEELHWPPISTYPHNLYYHDDPNYNNSLLDEQYPSLTSEDWNFTFNGEHGEHQIRPKSENQQRKRKKKSTRPSTTGGERIRTNDEKDLLDKKPQKKKRNKAKLEASNRTVVVTEGV